MDHNYIDHEHEEHDCIAGNYVGREWMAITIPAIIMLTITAQVMNRLVRTIYALAKQAIAM